MSLGLFIPNKATMNHSDNWEGSNRAQSNSQNSVCLLPCELKFNHSGMGDDGFTGVLVWKSWLCPCKI